MLEKTYHLEDGPPPWTWEEYEEWLTKEWSHVLDVNANSEKELHAFLAKHPSLLPGGEGGDASIGGHHGAFPPAVVSQPPLPGIDTRFPDFLWVSKHSGALIPVLIEIEKATKRWFTTTRQQQTADLTQAVNQVAEWRTWMNRENNRLAFYELYGIDDTLRKYLKIEPVYSLIYGRRAEFRHDQRASTLRSEMRPNWLHWMTYDRLQPKASAANLFSVSLELGTRKFNVLHIPPTFRLGPEIAEDLPSMHNFAAAVEANELISRERKRFLIERCSYWLQWAHNARRGVRSTGDWE